MVPREDHLVGLIVVLVPPVLVHDGHVGAPKVITAVERCQVAVNRRGREGAVIGQPRLVRGEGVHLVGDVQLDALRDGHPLVGRPELDVVVLREVDVRPEAGVLDGCVGGIGVHPVDRRSALQVRVRDDRRGIGEALVQGLVLPGPHPGVEPLDVARHLPADADVEAELQGVPHHHPEVLPPGVGFAAEIIVEFVAVVLEHDLEPLVEDLAGHGIRQQSVRGLDREGDGVVEVRVLDRVGIAVVGVVVVGRLDLLVDPEVDPREVVVHPGGGPGEIGPHGRTRAGGDRVLDAGVGLDDEK